MSAVALTATAAQLADAMGVPKSTVIRRAQAEGWAYKEEPGRGGMRRIYEVDHLPAALRAKLTWRGVAQDATPASHAAAQAGRAEAARLALRGSLEAKAIESRRQADLRQAGELDARGQQRMDARLALVRAFEVFLPTVQGLPLAQARLLFCQHYRDPRAGDMMVSPAVRELLPTVSDSSLERWQRDIRTHGITALAGAYGNRAGSSKVSSHPELREFVQAMMVAHPHVRASHVMKALRGRFGPNGSAPTTLPASAMPSMRSLERWMADWRDANAEVLMALANPDAWKNKYMLAMGSKSEHVTAINQLWERDSSPADVMCTDGRYSLIGGVDVFTRTGKLLVSRTSKAVAVGAHLRAMLLEFGVPHTDKTDNGSDYTALYTERVYAGLDIEHQLCPPFQPWHKPHVERFFGTFARDLVELLPGYIGHSVAERSAIEARKSFADRLMKRGEVVELRMTGAELQAFCDQWVDTIYHRAPHEGLAQRTPWEMRAEHAHQVRAIADERALDVLLAEAPGRDGRRMVQKKGIKLDEGWFIAPELEAWVGQEVHVRYDPIHHDLGTVYVFAFGASGEQFICLAQNPDRTGVDRRDVAVKGKQLQRDRVQAERKALRAAAKKVGVDQVVDEILRERASAAGKLTQLPVRNRAVHTSPGLQAAANAAQAAHAAQQQPRTTADIEHLAQVQAMRTRLADEAVPKGQANDLATHRGPVPTPVFETVAERVQWLLRQAAHRELSTEEQDTLAQFKRAQPASYRRMQELVSEQMASLKEDAPGAIAGPSGAV